jgi:hypothetical protein
VSLFITTPSWLVDVRTFVRRTARRLPHAAAFLPLGARSDAVGLGAGGGEEDRVQRGRERGDVRLVDRRRQVAPDAEIGGRG